MDQPEISEPPRSITTAELLRKLADHVTGQDLKNERHRGSLPDLEDGLWSPLAVKRAKRLYRLRKLGAEGNSLKILLFLADGGGWDGIKEACIKGLDRTQAMSLNGVARYASDDANLAFSLEDISEHQHKALVSKSPDTTMNPTSVETLGFVLGLLRDGVPLKGGSARRLMVPLLQASVPSMTDDQVKEYADRFDELAGFMDLRAERQLERLQEATPEQVERGRLSVLERVRTIREMIREKSGEESKGQRNALTGFSRAQEMKTLDFSIGAVKFSSGLMFAGFVGNIIALDMAHREFQEFGESLEALIPMAMRMALLERRQA